MTYRLFGFLAALITTTIALQPVSATAADFSDSQKKAIGEIVREYILDNPEILYEAAEKHQRQQEEAADSQFKTYLSDNKDAVFNGAPTAGNPNGDIVIVEFFDYNCGYCKKAMEDVAALLKEDKNLKFVFKDMPILSQTSVDAARWSLAADKQGKYLDFHMELMKSPGQKDEKTFEQIAKKLGLDVEKLRKDADDESITKQIRDNMEQAQELGIRGTPGFIIGDYLARGYMGLDGMKQTIADQRAKK
ncbi:MAG: DsbA family protein [Rhodospirillales bacterium]|nr:DsbA family protein [Rhodospirillales bacterium]